jgi:hypothetical protein
MNISKIKNLADEGVWITIELDGVETDMEFKVLGSDSKLYRDKQRVIADKRFSKGMLKKISSAELEAEGLSLLTACVVDWSGVEDDSGLIECTPANVKQILKDNIWIREQIDAAVADRSNFITNSEND